MAKTEIRGTQIADGTVSLTADVTGTLPVGNGGTGATTLTGILKGNGTSAFTAVTAPSGAIVGDTDSQTLTNKTLTTPVIDQFGTASGLGAAWSAWTPTFTNVTPGNGTHNSSYKQIGKTVICRLRFTFGSTSSMGTGPLFSLPVTAASGYVTGQPLGNVRFLDSGVAGYQGVIWYNTTTQAGMYVYGSAAATVNEVNPTSTVPFSWGNGDGFNGFLVYEAA